MRSYVVQPGDSPAKISGKYAGCSKCARDLVRVNAHKPSLKAQNGFTTFKTLHVGETLNLPDKWFSPKFDAVPSRYFSALPHPDGRTPSTLGLAAIGVLNDYSALDSASSKITDLANLPDSSFADVAITAADDLSKSVQEVIAGATATSPAAVASALNAQASAFDAKARATAMNAALAIGTPVTAMRPQIKDVLSAGLDNAHAALNAFHAGPSTIPVTTAPIPSALQTLISLDPCAQQNATAVCAAQLLMGISPDGKYGDSTAAAARALSPNAPPPCFPRPAWWAPTGVKNCPGLPATSSPLPPIVIPLPSSPSTQSPPTSTPIASAQKEGLSTAGILGLGLLGAGVVGGAIYVAMNPKLRAKIGSKAPVSQRPTKRIRY